MIKTHDLERMKRETTCLRFESSLVRGQWWHAVCSCGWQDWYDTKKEADAGFTAHKGST